MSNIRTNTQATALAFSSFYWPLWLVANTTAMSTCSASHSTCLFRLPVATVADDLHCHVHSMLTLSCDTLSSGPARITVTVIAFSAYSDPARH